MLIAAHYAAAGQLDCARISDVIRRVYNRGTPFLADAAVTTLTAAIAVALTCRKFFITGYAPLEFGTPVIDEAYGLAAGSIGSGKSNVLANPASWPPDARAALEDPGTTLWVADLKNPAATGPWSTPAALASARPASAGHRRWLRRILRPAFTFTIPAGRTPPVVCAVASWIINTLVVPLGTMVLVLTATATPWPWQAPGRWHAWGACILAGLAADQLVDVQIGSAAAAGQAVGAVIDRLTMIIAFAGAAAAAAWPWPGWWADHFRLRVVLAVSYSIAAVFTTVWTVRMARRRP
jgi:hypothetical protein